MSRLLVETTLGGYSIISLISQMKRMIWFQVWLNSRLIVFSADQEGCELGPFWGNVEDALGVFARLVAARWDAPVEGQTAGSQQVPPAPGSSSQPTLASPASALSAWVAFPFPVECWSLSTQWSWPASDKYHLITEQAFLPFLSARLLLPEIKLHSDTTELPF